MRFLYYVEMRFWNDWENSMDRRGWSRESHRLAVFDLPPDQWVDDVRRAVVEAADDDLGTHLVACVVLARAASEYAPEAERRRAEKAEEKLDRQTGSCCGCMTLILLVMALLFLQWLYWILDW